VNPENDLLRKATHEALRMMKSAGFEITTEIQVIVDPKLPFMGYSTSKDDKDTIVVAGQAVQSGMIEGLLVHEMSHIYQTHANHPSHNHELLGRVQKYILNRGDLTADYKIKLIQEAVNHVQDLYADDISFKVFKGNEAFQDKSVFDFFLTWIEEKPLRRKGVKSAWMNVGIMLNNCFVLCNMMRHGLHDVNGRAASKVQKFLSETNSRMKDEFSYFRDYMVNLEEDPNREYFEKGLTCYLVHTIELAKDLSTSGRSLKSSRAGPGVGEGA
jgi:hypothetical protein